MTEMTQAADTAAMRAEADQLNASVREDNRSLYERQRRAAQLAWEADLIDEAELALAELEGTRGSLARLADAVAGAVTAERAAEDRLRADERHLARRQAEQHKADAEYAPVERQEQLADHVRTSAAVVARGRQAVSAARGTREQAQAVLAEREAYVAVLDREHAEARRRAENPGTAPNMPGFAPGVSKVSDMDDETRAALALVVMTLGSQSLSSAPAPAPGRGRRTTNGEWAAQDPAGWRHIRRGTSMFAIPPAPGH